MAKPKMVTVRRIQLLVFFFVTLANPLIAYASGYNVDFGIQYGTPTATYGAASGQAGLWNEVDLGATSGLINIGGSPTLASVTVTAGGVGFASPPSVTDDEVLMDDNFFETGSWQVDFSNLPNGQYAVYLYAPANFSVPTGNMVIGGQAVANLTGDSSAALIQGTSWEVAVVTVSDGTLALSSTFVGFIGLAGVQLVPMTISGYNVDFGIQYGTPMVIYGAASSQAGLWNEVDVGTTTGLTNIDGGPTLASVTVTAGGVGFSSPPSVTGDEVLMDDIFFETGSWQVDFSNLPNGQYAVYLYAPANFSVPTGNMVIGGQAVANLTGDSSAALIQGTSWEVAVVTVSDGTLALSSTFVGFVGLAGVQLVPMTISGYNVDFGIQYGTPTATYGAASGQAGLWNEADLGTTSGLINIGGGPTLASVTVTASTRGFSTPPSVTGDEVLMDDIFFDTGSWQVDFLNLPNGQYAVYLYAPSNSSAPTGDMVVGGQAVSNLTGDTSAALIQGTSWEVAVVTVSDGTLALSSTFAGFIGLAGVQLVPMTISGYNLDFGIEYGTPMATYGAASGQTGPWNEADLGTTSGLINIGGGPTLASVTVTASTRGFSTPPSVTGDEVLMDDIFFDTGSWQVDFLNLPNGQYAVYLYAPSNSSAPTGNMVVGGQAVANLTGSISATLIQGTSWEVAVVTVSDGTLALSSTFVGFVGLAGVQLVRIPDSADLAVTKTDDQDFLLQGDSLIYLITINNNGPSDILGAQVFDALQFELSPATWECFPGPGASCDTPGNGNISASVDIPAGSFVSYMLTAGTDPGFLGVISNTVTATVPGHIFDPDPSNNRAADTTEIVLVIPVFKDGFE